MKNTIVAMLCCILFFTAAAQSARGDYKTQLRLQPLSLFDPLESNLRFGMDELLKPKLAVGADASVYFAADAYSKPLSGFAIAPFIRWYTSTRRNTFIETGMMYKFTQRKEEGWLGMDCVNDVPTYEKYDSYKRRKQVFDLSFRFGMRESLFKSPKWSFEMFVGLGIRYKMFSIKYAEANTCIIEDGTDVIGFWGNTTNPPDNYAFISVPMGVRFTRKLR